ncbi:hypothetical protein OG216_23600 [Streptomycetaceae bacterium NBC_01309]
MRETRPEAVRVRPSGDPDRPVELALNDQAEPVPGCEWDRVHFTRAQARTVMLAFTAELARTMPGPIIQQTGSSHDPT